MVSPPRHIPVDLNALAQQALAEVGRVFDRLPGTLAGQFVAEVGSVQRVALYGVGREGLVMRSLAMRLYHAGLRAFVVGDMAAEPLGPGDLLIVSAGPGSFSTVEALIGVARGAGARTLIFSAEPEGESVRRADVLLHLPAQTMNQPMNQTVRLEPAGPQSVLPMGSLYELSLWLLCDLLIEALKQTAAIGPETMQARHTNLE